MPRPPKLGNLPYVVFAPVGSSFRGKAPRTPRLLVAPFVVTLAALACGPSMQSIHEGSVRFEHCYRLDLDPKIAPSHRHACWEQWTRVYSYGQARDRVEYARRRIEELEAGDPAPPRLDLDDAQTRPEREFYMSIPSPTDAHAPPPPMATTPEEPPRQQVPGDECIIRCRAQRGTCLTGCKADPKDAEAKPTPQKPQAKKAEKKDEADQQAEPQEGDSEGEAEPVDGKCNCEADYKACAMRCFE